MGTVGLVMVMPGDTLFYYEVSVRMLWCVNYVRLFVQHPVCVKTHGLYRTSLPWNNSDPSFCCIRWLFCPPSPNKVQGMSFLAAVLLLNMDSSEAFVCLCNLLAQPCYSVFFRIDRDLVGPAHSVCTVCIICIYTVLIQMQPYFDVFNHYFKEEVKSVYAHFEILDLLPHYYLMEWCVSVCVCVCVCVCVPVCVCRECNCVCVCAN